MKYPNAYQGIKKIFSAEVLSLIASVCMIGFAIFGIIAIAAVQTTTDEAVVAGSIGAVVFGLAGGILSLISLILLLVGTKRASLDEESFNKAFIFIICSLVLTVASTVLSSMMPGATWDDLSKTIANILTLFATVYIIGGVQNLAKKLDRPDMVKNGNTYMILLIIVYVIQIITRAIPVFFGENAATSNVAGILTLVAEIFSLIVYIIYLVFLGKAKKMLKEN